MKNSYFIIFALFALLFVTATECKANYTSLICTGDANVADHDNFIGSRDANYGDSEYITARMVLDRTGNITDRDRSYLKFDLGIIPDNATILNASLNLFYHTSTGLHFSGDISLFHIDEDLWTESSITWNNQPMLNLNNDKQLTSFSKTDLPEDRWVQWDIFSGDKWSYKNDLIDDQLSLLMSLEANLNQTDVWPYSSFLSSENGGYEPYLTIEYEVRPVPLPGAVWLLGSGLLGFVGVKRKNNFL